MCTSNICTCALVRSLILAGFNVTTQHSHRMECCIISEPNNSVHPGRMNSAPYTRHTHVLWQVNAAKTEMLIVVSAICLFAFAHTCCLARTLSANNEIDAHLPRDEVRVPFPPSNTITRRQDDGRIWKKAHNIVHMRLPPILLNGFQCTLNELRVARMDVALVTI